MKKLSVLLLAALAFSARADDVTLYKIQNRWLKNLPLTVVNNSVAYQAADGDASLWSLEPAKDGMQRLKNKASGKYLALKAGSADLTVSAPCYFECRFIAQSAPTSWPAFWVMTRDTYKGLQEPADELDIIEGYGGFGSGFPNQTGYWITSHQWNQKEDKLPGVYKQVPMTKLGGQSSWWETFHIYGCKITETDTVYYCDNVEVGRHPTYPLSKAQPFFFFINFAFPGHGWPMDPSQYGGVMDMYVDYVRVWGRE